jgi:chromosome segregation ATPase
MRNHHGSDAPGQSAKSAGIAMAIAFGFAMYSSPAAAQTCAQTIDFLNAAKTARTGYEFERTAVQERIVKLEQGAELFRKQLESGDCRSADAKADAKDSRPMCESLLKIVMEAKKGRASLESQLDELKQKSTEATETEQKLVKHATTEGCPPYGTKSTATEAPAKAQEPAKQPVQKPRRPRATAQQQQPEPSAPRSGVVIQFGRGGGVGFGF